MNFIVALIVAGIIGEIIWGEKKPKSTKPGPILTYMGPDTATCVAGQCKCCKNFIKVIELEAA